MCPPAERLSRFINAFCGVSLSYLKEEGLRRVIDWRVQHKGTAAPGRKRSSKFAKALLRAGESNDFYTHEVGFPIEIIPESAPHTTKACAALPIRVMFMGKPPADL